MRSLLSRDEEVFDSIEYKYTSWSFNFWNRLTNRVYRILHICLQERSHASGFIAYKRHKNHEYSQNANQSCVICLAMVSKMK